MNAAKWHREQAANHADDAASAERNVRRNDSAAWAENCAREIVRHQTLAAHHATAADALEALAVPGVADLIEGLMDRDWMGDPSLTLSEALNAKRAQRASLSTLARIAKESK